MSREPLGLYIFRLLVSFGIFAILCMVYWSSVLNEQHLIDIRVELQNLKRDIQEIEVAPPQYLEANGFINPKPGIDSLEGRPHIDPSLPNLLKEDPFYEVTLPDMLGVNFRPRGTFKRASTGKPDNLHPFSNWAEVNDWRGMCTASLARNQFGKYETFAPDMAIKIEARPQKGTGVTEFWVHLRDKVYWQPLNPVMFTQKLKLAPQFLKKNQVTSHDFKFNFDAIMNPYNQEPRAVAQRTYYDDIKEIEVIDDLTFIVRWRVHEISDENGNLVPRIRYIAKQLTGGLTPLPSFVYKYFSDGSKIVENDSDPETYRTNSIWAQNFSEHWAKNIIVSCGGWIFEKMTDQQIRFRRNPNHYFPLDVLVERAEVTFKNSPDGVWQDFKAGNLDNYSLQPDQLIELKEFLDSPIYKEQETKDLTINRLDYSANVYYYIGWNMSGPFFSSQKVRQAMTLAIDRERIIKQLLNGLGVQITGPFSQFSPSTDPSIIPWPFDPVLAKEMLEEDGWYDTDGDGILDKEINGKKVPFEFRLTYYVKNPTTKGICEYVATALKEIGVRCLLNGVDLADLSATFDEKNFDAYCLGWRLGSPPEDPRQLWHSDGAKLPGSSNAVGFTNSKADEIIEQLAFESNHEKRVELYHQFHAIIHEEQPYTFIYAPKVILLYRDYLQNVFIPSDRQDLIPGADISEPSSSIFWLKKKGG